MYLQRDGKSTCERVLHFVTDWECMQRDHSQLEQEYTNILHTVATLRLQVKEQEDKIEENCHV